MNLLGIIDVSSKYGDAKRIRAIAFDGCEGGISNAETYGSNNRICFTFSIVNVLCVDKLVSNVKKLTKDLGALRLLYNGRDINVAMLK